MKEREEYNSLGSITERLEYLIDNQVYLDINSYNGTRAENAKKNREIKEQNKKTAAKKQPIKQ